MQGLTQRPVPPTPRLLLAEAFPCLQHLCSAPRGVVPPDQGRWLPLSRRAPLSVSQLAGCHGTPLGEAAQKPWDLFSECQNVKHKRPVTGSGLVIAVISSLRFNFQHCSPTSNNKVAGIVSQPGEETEPGYAAAAASCCLRCNP